MSNHSLRQRPHHQCYSQLLFIVVLSILLSVSNAAFVLHVPANDEVCFVVRTPKGPESSLLSGSFDLLDDDLSPDPITVQIYDEKLDIHYKSEPKVKSGTFSVVVNGRIYVCVMSGVNPGPDYVRDHNSRQVGLNVQVRTLDKTSSVMECVQRIQSKLWNFRAQHDYMRTREALHRELVEQTFTKLLVWSLVEAACVLLASAMQIMYMRRFVEKRRAF